MFGRSITVLPWLLCMTLACGGSSDPDPNTTPDAGTNPDSGMQPDSGSPDPLPDCPSGNCGKESFRRAIPTSDLVRIDFGNQSQAGRASSRAAASNGPRSQALDPVSPSYLAVAGYVDSINGTIIGIFDSIDVLASSPAEIAEDTVHQWRAPDSVDASLEHVLVIESEDGVTYQLSMSLGPAGFEPTAESVFISGTVVLEDETTVQSFELIVDLDAIAAITGDATKGLIGIRAMPFAGGLRETWYDFADVALGDAPPVTSISTYWVFEEGSGALEYLDVIENEMATVYARWDAQGGRYDHHVAYVHETIGQVDDIATNCWGPSSEELFDAWAFIDQELNYYGEIEGSELDCIFGPVANHPNPGDAFLNLPAQGEWENLELGSLEPPLCVDDPQDPACIPFCEDVPEDPACVPYCDVYPTDPLC